MLSLLAVSTAFAGAAPAFTSISPSSAPAGSADFQITITGSALQSGDTFTWSAATGPTATTPAVLPYVSNTGGSTLVVNVVGLIETATPGTVTLTMIGPNGVVVGTLPFTVLPPASGGGGGGSGGTASTPTLTGFSPPSASAGGPAFTLQVNGTGFVTGATVLWGTTSLTTTFVSATQLTAAVPASLIATAATVNITVTNPGVSTASSAKPFTVGPPASLSVTSLSPATAAPGSPAFTLTVNGAGFVAADTVVWNNTNLTTTFVSATQLTAAVPASLVATAGTANVQVANLGALGTPPSNAVQFAIAAPAPTITSGGIVPLYSTSTTIQPGSWISIYGANLASSTATWTGNFPTTLGGVSVTIDNKPAYLWFVSPTQINAQAPADTATGSVQVVVTNGTATATGSVTLGAQSPSFNVAADGTHAVGIVLTPNGNGSQGGGSYDFVGPQAAGTRPVKAGETLELFGVGFGATNPAVTPGQVFSGSAPTVNPVTVTIGGVSANVSYSGMTAAGQFQINLVVPTTGKTGDQALVATVNGVSTPASVVLATQ